MTLLTIEHKQQQRESDCLVACAQMVLNHLGVELNYGRIASLLDVTESYGLLGNLVRLAELGLYVDYNDFGDVAHFERYLKIGLPIIAGVQTIGWKHWHQEVTSHAVVVTGLDTVNQTLFVHDPFLDYGPLEMSVVEFEIGWFEMDARYAAIGLIEIE